MGVSSLVTIGLAVDFVGSAEVGQWARDREQTSSRPAQRSVSPQCLIKADDVVIARPMRRSGWCEEGTGRVKILF